MLIGVYAGCRLCVSHMLSVEIKPSFAELDTMLSVTIKSSNARCRCRYSECQYPERRYAECRYPEYRYAVTLRHVLGI
jgi:hypothetical protein